MKRSIFLSTILCLVLICSNQQLNCINKTKLINAGLMLGGAGLAFFSLIEYDLCNKLIKNIIHIRKIYSFDDKYKEREIINYKESQKTSKAFVVAGLIICGIGIHRSCK